MEKLKISTPKRMKCKFGYIHMIEAASNTGKHPLK